MPKQDMNKDERHEEGQRRFQEWRNELLSTPEGRTMYEDEGKKLDKWLASEEQKAKPKHSKSRAAKNIPRGFAPALKGMFAKKRGND